MLEGRLKQWLQKYTQNLTINSLFKII